MKSTIISLIARHWLLSFTNFAFHLNRNSTFYFPDLILTLVNINKKFIFLDTISFAKFVDFIVFILKSITLERVILLLLDCLKLIRKFKFLIKISSLIIVKLRFLLFFTTSENHNSFHLIVEKGE